ncbi:MAG TPA: EamA family transporter [Streptosporangiaceae bacterium]|nr:EamA family transporter [Streptosporangiaceae bacterium]
MAGIVLALLAAATYGASDFFGGLSSRRAPVPVILFYSQLASVAPLVIALLLLPAAHATGADYGWGAAAGLISLLGMSLLYLSLAVGPMSVAAPVTAVCVAVLPTAAGLALGERLSAQTLAGLVLGIGGVGLISLGPRQQGSHAAPAGRVIPVAAGAGACLGAFFIVLSRTSPGSGLLPLLATRAVTVGILGSLAGARMIRARSRSAARVPRPARVAMISAGVLDMTGNFFYVFAVRHGPLAVIAVITALYPAATVLLAWAVLRERLSLAQGLGTGAAMACVSLLALSRA